MTHAETLFLRLRTDDGREGWGEAAPFPIIHGETLEGALATARHRLGPSLIGFPVASAPALRAHLNKQLHGNHCLKSGLDMAFHDLLAQQAGLPLYRYLGGDGRRPLHTDYTVSLGTVADMVGQARWIVSAGFPAVKVKLGQDATGDLARLRAIRHAIGPDLPLLVDANQGWSFQDAVRALRGMKKLGVTHCEEPIDRYDWTRLPELRALSPVPIMADESCCTAADARRLRDIGAIDRINIKLSKSGGLHEGRRIVEVAGDDVPLQVGGFLESRLGFTAAAHLAMSSERVRYCDFDTPLMQSEDPVEGGILYGPGGEVSLPTGPGLGARLAANYQQAGREQYIVE